MQSSEIGMSANPGNAFHPNTQEPEAEGSRQIVGPPYLHIKFQASQGCIVECCFKNKNQTNPTKPRKNPSHEGELFKKSLKFWPS